jgi:alpha-beta hydrolase superfamily lysophospholipase
MAIAQTIFESEDPTVAQVVRTWAPRMIVQGIDYNDFLNTSARIRVWDDWCREWCATAAMHEDLARQAETRGETVSAGEGYFLAAIAYHFAANNFVHDYDQYIPAHQKKVACYASAAPLLSPPAERHMVRFDNIRMPGYLRLPPTSVRPELVEGRPPPVVVIISGVDSTKEEHRTMEDGLLRRGLATFSFDGPGQGETWFQMGMIVDFERATSAVIDYLESLRQVDARRVGVFGPSMGGYLAPRSAGQDRRIKACAASGGSFDRQHHLSTAERDPFQLVRLRHLWKVDSKERLTELMNRATLDGIAQKIRCPLLIIHGTRDMVPVSEAERTYAAASGPKELVILEGGNHVCNNMPYRYRPLVGDFLARNLVRS